MPAPENRFDRLTRMARRAPDDLPADELPPALATRVLARLRAGARAPVSPWEWLSFRAVPIAAAAAAVCVFTPDGLWSGRPADEVRFAQALIQSQLTP